MVRDRFAEACFDPDRGLRVTVIDLEEQDLEAVSEIAGRLGIRDWVRTEGADPDALAAWERLRHDLHRLRSTRARVLTQYPMPDPGYRRPPVEIHLAPDAEATAAELNHRYGEFVSLQVGALPYPPGHAPGRYHTPHRSGEAPAWDPTEMQVALDGPLSERSGDTAHHSLLLTNLSEQEIRVHTNGHVTATIVDEVGAAVGGYAGAQHQRLVIFTGRSSPRPSN